MDIVIVLAGFFIGTIVGISGIGAGSITTPFLLLYGVSPIVAVGTNLFYTAATKLSALWIYQREGVIQWRIVCLLCLGSIPATGLILSLLNHYDAKGYDFNGLITLLIGISLVLNASVMLFKTHLMHVSATPKPLRQNTRAWATVAAGFAIGTLVSLSSIGAGTLGAAILLLIYPNLPARNIVGVDIAHAVPLALVAGFGHWHLGSIDFALLLNLLIGSIPGILIGSQLGRYFTDQRLRTLLASLLFCSGLGFVIKTL